MTAPNPDRARYRVGNHQPKNVYRDDEYIGVMFTPEDAALVVESMNETERIHGPALPIAITAPVQHRPERRGSDSEGYGHCTGCGQLWPCPGYRGEVTP